MKKSAIILLILAIVFSVTTCEAKPAKSNEPANIGDWKITVVTSTGEKEFKSADAAKLTAVTLEATTKNKNGEESTSAYTGVKLSDILNQAGIIDFTGLTIEAGDGFSAEYDEELALKDDTILAWEKDGKLLEGDNPVQMVPKTGFGNQFVKNISRIIVND